MVVQQIVLCAQWPLFGAAGPRLQSWLLGYGFQSLWPTVLTPYLIRIRSWNREGKGACLHLPLSRENTLQMSGLQPISPSFKVPLRLHYCFYQHWGLYTPYRPYFNSTDLKLADSPWNPWFKIGAISKLQLMNLISSSVFVVVPFIRFQERVILLPCC